MMKVKSKEKNDFFVRSKDTRTFRRNDTQESEHDDSLNSASERSTPVKTKRHSQRLSTPSGSGDRHVVSRSITVNKESANDSEEDEYTSRKRIQRPMERSHRSERSISRISSLSERSRQSFSTDHDSDDQDRDNTYETNGNEEESVTESSIQHGSPMKKKTSADLLAEESSQLLLSQGITEG